MKDKMKHINIAYDFGSCVPFFDNEQFTINMTFLILFFIQKKYKRFDVIIQIFLCK